MFPLFLWRKSHGNQRCSQVREKRNLEIVDEVSQQQKFHQLQSAGDFSFNQQVIWAFGWRIQALMEFKTATNRRLSNAASTGLYGTGVGGVGGGGASRLSLYQVAPCVEVSIEEFEQFALDRLRGFSFFLSSAALQLLLLPSAVSASACMATAGEFSKKKRKGNGVAVCMSVVENWFEEKSFSFFLIGAFLWAVLKAIEENRARGRRLEEVEAVVCAAAAPAWGLFVFVYIAMIVMCTMWLDGWWWPWLSIFVFALAKSFNNFQSASRVCRRAARIQMIFMLARVCTHFVKQKPLKPLKPLSWFILLTVECGFLFWVSSPGSSSSRWWDAHRV